MSRKFKNYKNISSYINFMKGYNINIVAAQNIKWIFTVYFIIIDVNNGYSKEQLLNLKNITGAIFLLDQKVNEEEFLDRIKLIALTPLIKFLTRNVKH